MTKPKKSLGQHWLKNDKILSEIVDAADLKKTDLVLEVGPGPGGLTRHLVRSAGQVIAIELDDELAGGLSIVVPAENLAVVHSDILKFDLTALPANYKVVANIPYYLTSNLVRVLSESANPPVLIVLLVQKEVAERIDAKPGEMSILAVSAQLYYRTSLGPIVKAELFEPVPKVDSQVIILARRSQPLFSNLDEKLFFRIVKAGFAGRRKKLRSSLAAGLNINKSTADELLSDAGVEGDLRAQNLSLQDWHKLYIVYKSANI